jgi:hypothetical protein
MSQFCKERRMGEKIFLIHVFLEKRDEEWTDGGEYDIIE